jgi:fibronectin type 3 domain-containing protein
MRRYGILVALALAVAALGLHGCFGDLTAPKHDNPMDPDNPNTHSAVPPTPRALSAVVSDRLVVLSWTMSSTTSVTGYRIYRWEVVAGGSEDYQLLDSSDATEYEDRAVRNGQEYSYKVAALNLLGLEGNQSSARSATPSIFSVAIERGRPKTASRSVELTLSGPAGTALVLLSNSSDLSDGTWETFQATLPWELEPGDGTKVVYAKFRDSFDNESGIASDDIVLDTRAIIESVTEDTGGQAMQAGDTIHLAVTAGEPYGRASVDLGDAVTDIALYDDGTGGDADADDGVYERDYVVEYGVEIVDAVVTGYFTDELGNEAEPTVASGTVTVHAAPGAVTMLAPIALSERRLALSWTRSNTTDFASYKLYRSYVPGVGTSLSRVLLSQISDPGETEYTDGGLRPDSTYYYAVYVVDGIGLATLSNEVAGTTMPNDPPSPVELYEPWPTDTTSLAISWSQSEERDFRCYELFGWEQDPPHPPNTSSKRLIARLTTPGETFYTHTGLIDSLVYWYEVAVVDSFGARALSGSVSGALRPPLK